jgi:hypothetical protein
MTLWQWALIGAGAWLGLGLVMTLGVAAVLGHLSRKLSTFEHDWSSAPLTRDSGTDELHVPDRVEDEEAIVAALRR